MKNQINQLKMNHVQNRAMDRLGEFISINEIKKITQDILDGRCKRYLSLGKTFGIYQAFLNNSTEALIIFDYHYRVIRTIGHPSWIKKKGSVYIYSPKKKKEDIEDNSNNRKKRKVPYVRSKYKQSTKEMLQRND